MRPLSLNHDAVTFDTTDEADTITVTLQRYVLTGTATRPDRTPTTPTLSDTSDL